MVIKSRTIYSVQCNNQT